MVIINNLVTKFVNLVISNTIFIVRKLILIVWYSFIKASNVWILIKNWYTLQ